MPSQLPHVNSQAGQHYSTAYNNESRELVAQLCAKDIEAFGYSFEEAT